MEPESHLQRLLPMNLAHAGAGPGAVELDQVDVGDPQISQGLIVEDGFTTFYASNRDRIARALALTLRDAHLGAEAVDEAMTRAYQRWARVKGLDDPSAWVYRVALNWATSVLRRRLRPQRGFHQTPEGLGPIGEPAIADALSELDVKQRAVVICRFYLGMSEAETATALKIRPGTVKSRLHRSLRLLETRLAHLRPEDLT